MKNTTIFYRGTITYCNYSCSYCPFARLFNTSYPVPEILLKEQEGLERLYTFLEERDPSSGSYTLFFAPRGEILILECYRTAIARLSSLENVEKVVIQTNFTFPPDWLDECNQKKIALWITYHPEQIEMGKFLTKLTVLTEKNVTCSIGMVGLKEYKTAALKLRKALDNTLYLWINAFKDRENYYNSKDIDFYTAIDPLFPQSLTSYDSIGKACYAGEKLFTLDSRGFIKPCFFQDKVLGNIDTNRLDDLLKPQLCPVPQCTCYIGYSNLKEPGFADNYSNMRARIAKPEVLCQIAVPEM